MKLKTIPRRKPFFEKGLTREIAAMALSGSTKHEVENELLEEKMKAVFGYRNVAVVSSGRIALKLILETSGLERGSEIIVPGYTFSLVLPAIAAVGFNPVPVDIDPCTFQMDPNKAEEAITQRTGGILVTHLFGEPSNIERFQEICERNSILLIEDCAQAIGALSNNRFVGTFGNAGFASFDISKPLHGFSGGAIFTSNDAWAGRIREKISGEEPARNSHIKQIFRGFLQHVVINSLLWRFVIVAISSKSVQKLFYRAYRKNESQVSGGAVEVSSPALHGVMARTARRNLESLDSRLSCRRLIRDLYKKHIGDCLEFQTIPPITQARII